MEFSKLSIEMLICSSFIVLFAVFVALFTLTRLAVTLWSPFGRRRGTELRSLDGPRPLPFFGNVLGLDRSRPYETFTSWSKVFGGIYQVRLFSQRTVVLSSFEAIQETFGVRGKDFSGRPKRFFRASFMSDDGQDIVSASPSPAWNALRRTVQREMKRFDPGLDRLERLTGLIMDEMVEEFSRHRLESFDPRESVYGAIMAVNCLFLAGERFTRDSTELRLFRRLERLVTESMNIGGAGMELDLFPWLRFFGNSTYRKLSEAKRIRDILYDWLRIRVVKDMETGKTNNGVVHGLFAAMTSPVKGQEVTETGVKLAIVNLLIGGSSATTAYLYLLINILAQYPDVQARVRSEVDEVLGPSGGRQVGLRDRESMPYSRACLLELLRFGSLSPILIPHMTLAETTVQGYTIPAGIQVLLNVRAVHHDPVFWKDPYDFRPERFLDAVSGRLLPPEAENRKRVLSFGGGPRVCPGEQLAMSRLFIAMVTIVQRFVVDTPTGQRSPESCDPRTFDLGLVLSPRAYEVSLIERVYGGEDSELRHVV